MGGMAKSGELCVEQELRGLEAAHELRDNDEEEMKDIN